MPAFLATFLEWIIGLFGTAFVTRFIAYIKQKIADKKAHDEKVAVVKQEVQNLENAQTTADRDKAADDILNNI